MAKDILIQRKQTKHGDKIEIRIWKITKSDRFPEGIKYSMSFIHKGKRILGYDNEHTKGHHKHMQDTEFLIKFTNWLSLLEQFEKEVKELQNKLYGGNKNEN